MTAFICSSATAKQWQVIGSWMKTHRRRLIGTGVVVVGWCAVTYPTGAMWLPKLYHQYTPMTTLPISQTTIGLVNEVIMDLNLERTDKPINWQKLAIVQGHNPFPEFQHRGNFHSGTAFIVLTTGFEREQMSRLLPKQISKKLTLPTEVQKFALARQIVYAEDYFEQLKCLVGLVCIVLYSLLAYRVTKKFQSPEALQAIKNLLRREQMSSDWILVIQDILRFPALALPLAHLYWGCIYGYSRHIERKADKVVASLGHEYVLGGFMFYQKAIELGQKKTRPIHYKHYKENGDLNAGWIHQRTLPYSERLKLFEDILQKEQQSKKTQEESVPAPAPQT